MVSKKKIEIVDHPRDVAMVVCQCGHKMEGVYEGSADGVMGIGWTITDMKCPRCKKSVSIVWRPHIPTVGGDMNQG